MHCIAVKAVFCDRHEPYLPTALSLLIIIVLHVRVLKKKLTPVELLGCTSITARNESLTFFTYNVASG